MKNFLLALLPNLTTKAAVTAAVCVTAGAAASGAVSTAVYTHKTAEYKETIQQLEEEVAQTSVSGGGSVAKSGDGSQQATAVRVVDGILEVWDGSDWVDYGSVDDVRSGDPFYENEDKRAEVEQSVAAKKLDELGLEINEEGEIVKKEPVPGEDPAATDTAQAGAGKKDTIILVGSTAGAGNNSANTNKNNTGKTANTSKAAAAATATTVATAGLTPEQVMATIQAGGIAPGATTLSTSPTAGVTNVSWTTPSSSGGGGGGGGGGGSSDSGGGGGSVSQPVSQPSSGGGDTGGGGGGGDTGGGGGDTGGGGNEEPSVSEGGGGGDWGGDVE